MCVLDPRAQVSRWLYPVWGLFALAGCGGSEGAREIQASVGDGVFVKEVSGDTLGTVTALEKEPQLLIGDGPDAIIFQGVSGILRLPNAQLVVAEHSSQTLRYFDRRGRVAGVSGGEGEGPGEFRGLTSLVEAGADSILAVDPRLRRLSWFDVRGQYGRSVTIERPLRRIGVVGDSVIMVVSTMRAQVSESGVFADTIEVALFRFDGSFHSTVGRFAGRTYDVRERVDVTGQRHSAIPMPLHFSMPTLVGISTERAFVVAPHDGSITLVGPDGRIEGIVRRRVPSVAVTPAHIRRAVQAARAQMARFGLTPQTRSQLQWLEETPSVDVLPVFGPSNPLVDPGGNVWIQRFSDAGAPSVRFEGFSPRGDPLGSLLVPGFLRVGYIGEGVVVGVQLDESGVERVAIYRVAS